MNKHVVAQLLPLEPGLLLETGLQGHLEGLENVPVLEEADLGGGLRVLGDETLLDHLLCVDVAEESLEAKVEVESVQTDLLRQVDVVGGHRLQQLQSLEQLHGRRHGAASVGEALPDLGGVVQLVGVDPGGQADHRFGHVARILETKKQILKKTKNKGYCLNLLYSPGSRLKPGQAK